MGVGNYYLSHAQTVYVDMWDVYSSDEPDTWWDYQQLVDNILEVLSPAYRPRHLQGVWLDRERKLLAESDHFRVSLVEWESYFAVNVETAISTESRRRLPRGGLLKEAMAIFERLNARYPLRVRDTGWTSMPYSVQQLVSCSDRLPV